MLTPIWAVPILIATVVGCASLVADSEGDQLHGPTHSPTSADEPRPPPIVLDDARSAHSSARWPGRSVTADALVVGRDSLSRNVRRHVEAIPGVRVAAPLSVASVAVADRTITVAAVDPRSYRRFVDERTASVEQVWTAISRGEVILSHRVGRSVGEPLGGTLPIGRQRGHIALRIGGYATTVPHIDAVVDQQRGAQLGLTPDNGLLLSVDHGQLSRVLDAVSAVVGRRTSVHRLTPTARGSGSATAAYLTGGAVARAVGSFRYRYFPDGSVQPENAWVAANIRTEPVPILGQVTCHRVMLPQLRGALAEIVRRGLSDTIDRSDYGGCYVPRFIGRDSRNGLSLHTWGIAIDLNVSGNQRGTVGEIDRRVVSIFKKWGFAWGGDWQWTDPMHFELAALVTRTSG